MKISELITEEMMREIYPGPAVKSEVQDDYLRIYDKYNTYVDYDLARFLFVDAWDYFREKDWDIKIFDKKSDLGGHITVYKGEFVEYYHTLLVTNYPSRLHAVAAAMAYMWEQEKKTNEH